MKKKKNLPETPEEILSYVTPHRMAAWKKKAEEGLATYFFIQSSIRCLLMTSLRLFLAR